jgi:hypothetical protein
LGSYSFQFLVLGQHLLAGVNEWLMIRNLDREIFKWLLICRCDVRHGSRRAQSRPEAMGGASGKIGAVWFRKAAVAFSPHRLGSKEDARNSLHWGRITLFCGSGSLKKVHPLYYKREIHL